MITPAFSRTAGFHAVLDGEAFHINIETFQYAFRSALMAFQGPYLDVDRLIRKSPLLRCGDVRESDMYRAWQLVLGALSNTSGYCDGLTLVVKNALEASFADDISSRPATRRGTYTYSQALADFMCLSSISYQAGSELIGHGLSSFWSHRGPLIVSDDPYGLVAWAKAIFWACMPGSCKVTALQEFMNADQFAMEQIQYNSPSVARVLATLDDIEQYQLENFDSIMPGFQGSPFASAHLGPPFLRSDREGYLGRPRSVSPYSSGPSFHRPSMHQRPERLMNSGGSPIDPQTRTMLADTARRVRRLEQDVAATKQFTTAALVGPRRM